MIAPEHLPYEALAFALLPPRAVVQSLLPGFLGLADFHDGFPLALVLPCLLIYAAATTSPAGLMRACLCHNTISAESISC